MRGVLAQVVAARQLQPEPVATEALVHLLGYSGGARTAVSNLLSELCPGALIGPLTFTGQPPSQEDQGRPDIVGEDGSGVRIVIEAKFDADLTAAQLGQDYLDRLPTEQAGALVFLVPADRLPAVWPRLLTGPAQLAQQELVHASAADKPFLRHQLPDGRVLAAVSWTQLLAAMRLSVANAAETGALGDLTQIEGLVEWRTRTGWTPLAPGDLPDRAGRQLAALSDSVLRAANLASDNKVRNGSGDSGPGRWIQTAGGQSFWAGLWLRGWSNFGTSPLWATVATANAVGGGLETALAKFQSPGGPGLYRSDARTWAVPLIVPPGAEHGPVVSALVEQLRRISEVLDAMPHVAASGPAGVDEQATVDTHSPLE